MVKAVLSVLLVVWLTAVCPDTAALERFEILTTAEVRELLTRREAGQADFLLVNTLDALIARTLTIPGSINLPWWEADQAASRLGEDREQLIITYCMGYR